MTPSTTTVDLNVGYPNIATVVHAVQGDNQSRILTANLYDGGIAWTPPAGAIGVIKFRTPLGTSGMYDTDEEGNTAVTWTGNVATLRIVQNALAVAGDVPMQLSFYDDQGAVITSFLWETLVQPSVLTDTQFMQTDYYNILSQQISAILTAIADIPEPATSAPLMDGTAAVGTQNTFARGDHRHPTDTSRAPTNHASTGTSYGEGNASNYGHVKLSDSTSSESGTSGGTAATPSAVKAAYDKANGKPDLSSTTPKMDGTAAVGTGTTAARADHVHPSDTSRVPTTRKVNNKALSADITLSASDVGAVTTTRKINNMDLTADRTLTAENISYDDGLSTHTAGSVGKELSELKGSLNSEVTARENADNTIETGIAIVANGNTHIAISTGQYVYVKNHSTISEGLYKAKTDIAANATLTLNTNIAAVSKGTVNDLFDTAYTTDGLTFVDWTTRGEYGKVVHRSGGYCKIGRLVIVNMRISITDNVIASGSEMITGLPPVAIDAPSNYTVGAIANNQGKNITLTQGGLVAAGDSIPVTNIIALFCCYLTY